MEARMKKLTAIRIVIVFALLLFFVPCVKALEVVIPDPGLEAAIREALGMGPTDPITDTDMETLQGLVAYEREIKDLTGLEYCANLQHLDLTRNNIRDISALSGLINLDSLNLSQNNIHDINALSGLINLGSLILDRNKISDTSALSGLTNLWHLMLRHNCINDLSGLSELNDLDELLLSNNNISDLSPLSGLSNLERMYLSHNRISDLGPLLGLTNLSGLQLSDNNVSDIRPLVGNSGLATGDWVVLVGNPLSDEAIDTDIPTLEGRGVEVYVFTGIDYLVSEIEGMNLARGTANSLIARLRCANRAYIEDDWLAYNKNLYAFIDQCEKMRGTKLTEDQADYLIEEATKLLD